MWSKDLLFVLERVNVFLLIVGSLFYIFLRFFLDLEFVERNFKRLGFRFRLFKMMGNNKEVGRKFWRDNF